MDAGPPPQSEALRQRRLTLSPSRAKDFKTCPLLYRFRAIDRLPEQPGPAAVRGILVHAVLEQLFCGPPADRTELNAVGSIPDVWERLTLAQPAIGEFSGADSASWLSAAATLVRSYFTVEDPRAFSPESCESLLEITIPGLHGAEPTPLKGVADRIDTAATGEVRIVDYKTGRAPSESGEMQALHQLKVYALMLYRLRGLVPDQLKLIYLGDATTLTYRPSADELIAVERGLVALWQAISSAVRTGHFPANRSSACNWCPHRVLCPEFGGTVPAIPAVALCDEVAR